MKKVLLLATAAFLVSGVALADTGKKKKKSKSKSCCSHGKSCSKDEKKDKTVSM